MSWTLHHRFLNAAGRPATGWVYFQISVSPLLTDVATIVSTGERIKLDRQGSFTVSNLPSEPDGFLILYPRITTGDPLALGPVAVPLQPDGTTIDLDQLLPNGWPAQPAHPVFPTRAEWDNLLARIAALEAAAGSGPDLTPILDRIDALETAVQLPGTLA